MMLRQRPGLDTDLLLLPGKGIGLIVSGGGDDVRVVCLPHPVMVLGSSVFLQLEWVPLAHLQYSFATYVLGPQGAAKELSMLKLVPEIPHSFNLDWNIRSDTWGGVRRKSWGWRVTRTGSTSWIYSAGRSRFRL